MSSLNPANVALARSRAYTLLADLYARGLTAESQAAVQQIDELATALPDAFDADRAAAAHQSLFGFNVFAHESIFLDTTGLIGGPVTERVIESYGALGWQMTDASLGADHLCEELTLLASLCAAESEAQRQQNESAIGRLQQHQIDFLQDHLLRWIVPCALAIRGQQEPFFSATAELTLDLLGAHAAELPLGTEPARGFALPPPPDLLGSDKTSLKDIAEFLTTPAYSGIFLSRSTISAVARQHNLPSGFASRAQMLTTVIRSAAQYESLPALLETVRGIWLRWQASYLQFGEGFPVLKAFIEPWRMRVKKSTALVEAIEGAVLANVLDT